MRTATISAIQGHEKWGAAVWVCMNAETLGVDVDGTPYTESEAAAEMAGAAGRAIQDAGLDYELDSFFPNWNGGRFCQFPDVGRGGPVCAYLYRWTGENDDDGDETGGEWEPAAAPAEVRAAVQAVIDAADAAMDAVKAKIEASKID